MRSFSIDSRVRAGTCEALPIASVGQVVASNTENVTIDTSYARALVPRTQLGEPLTRAVSPKRSPEDAAWRAADAGGVALTSMLLTSLMPPCRWRRTDTQSP